MAISPLRLTQLVSGAGLLHQHCCCHLRLPPGLTLQQSLSPPGGVAVAGGKQQGRRRAARMGPNSSGSASKVRPEWRLGSGVAVATAAATVGQPR